MTASTSEPTAIAWIQSELGKQHELPAADAGLCEFLRDGRALVWLAATLSADAASNNVDADALAVPKKIDRAMHQLTTFHALERIHFFIRWCRAAKLEEHLVFTSVQLLDEANADAVLACIDALRVRFRPAFRGKTGFPSPSNQDDEEEEEKHNHTTDHESVPSTSSVPPPSSASKLNAFLTQLPTAERQTSLTKRLSAGSLTSRHASSSVSSGGAAADDDDTRSSSRLSASPRSGSVAKLKVPPAFAAFAPPPPPPPEEVPEEPVVDEPEVLSSTPNRDEVNDYDEKIKNVDKLKIPPVFGRQSSNTEEHSTPKRTVSKLRIPAAFSGAGDEAAPPPPEEEAPAPPVPEEPLSNSPKSKLAAFAKTLAPTPPPAAAPVEEPKISKKKSTGKLKIPGVFGKAVGAAAPVPKKKPVTKLSAFLKTVDNEVPQPIEAKPERRFAFPIPGTEEAKKPVQPRTAPKPAVAAVKKNAALSAFMEKVVVGPPKPAPRVERDTVPVVHDEPVKSAEKPLESVVEESPAAAEPVTVVQEVSSGPAKPSALAAFMSKVVVAPPTPAPRLERDEEPQVSVVDEKPTETPEEAVPEVAQTESQPVDVEAEAPMEPSPPKSNRLLAFLAKVESPQASASEEELDDEDDTGTPAAVVPAHDADENNSDSDEQEDEHDEEVEEQESIADDEFSAVEEVQSVPDATPEVAVAVVEEEVAVTAEEPMVLPVEAEVKVEQSPEVDDTHVVEDDHTVQHDDDFVNASVESFPDHDVIVEVSGELTHEAMARRRLSSSAKPEVVRKLFQDEESESTHVIPDEASPAPKSTASAVAEQSVSRAKFQELEQAKQAVEAENEKLQQQIVTMEASVATHNAAVETLQTELAALRQQLELQKTEAETAQQAAIELVRRELEDIAARQESEHAAALEAVKVQAATEASAALQAQLTASETLAADRLEQLNALQAELAEHKVVLTQAKESEEAARYAAQMAFTARDKAEDESRLLQQKLDELTRGTRAA